MIDYIQMHKDFSAWSHRQHTDAFVYSGPINYVPASEFVDTVCAKVTAHKTCLLFLTTPGGDPHAAYRMIRSLRRNYERVQLGVVGPCKSAGTLISLGVHEIVMSDTGELGPLDVQLAKPDEIISNSSGLDIIEALAVTTESAFNALEQRMLDLVEHSGGAISTKTAAEISSAFAVELFKPIMAQIEPDRLGEVQRAIKIAQAYGEKLGMPNLRPGSMQKLVDGYPSHGFVIDLEEAKTLYQHVRPLEGFEVQLANVFKGALRHIRGTPQHSDIGEAIAKQAGAKNGTSPGKPQRKPDLSAGDGESTSNPPNARSNDKGRAVKRARASGGPARATLPASRARSKGRVNGLASSSK